MNFPCAKRIFCPAGEGSFNLDFDSPMANLSSEGADHPTEIASYFGNGWDDPNNGDDWTDPTTPGYCIGETQQQAEECAKREFVENTYDSGNGKVDDANNPDDPTDDNPQNPDPTGRKKQIFTSAEQSYTYTCPDGSQSTYTMPAGVYWRFSQAQADALAYSYARKFGLQYHMCIGGLPGTLSEICVDAAATLNLAVSSGVADTWVFSLIGGALPDGMTLEQLSNTTARISGTPTTAGYFSFTVGCHSARVAWQKTYVLSVVGIATDSLPNGTKDSAYAEALTTEGSPIIPLSWQIVDGALPDGLTLDESTGVISGTPTVPGTFSFTVMLQTAAT